jgi:hypothetical protein
LFYETIAVTITLMPHRNSSEDLMSKPAAPQTTIPQHVFERLESEWRQMQAGGQKQPKPAAQAGQV